MHLYFYDTITLARFTSTPFDIEAKTARFVSAHSGFGGPCKEFPDMCKDAGVSTRIRTRCSSNRALIDVDNLIDVLSPQYLPMSSCRYPCIVQFLH